MEELILEPYAIVQHWHLPGANPDWCAFLEAYLGTLAQNCARAGPCLIGHIKALVLFEPRAYLRASIVAPGRPVTFEGRAPAGLSQIELTLNVIVYGLKRELLAKITAATARQIAVEWQGDLTLPAIQNPSGSIQTKGDLNE